MSELEFRNINKAFGAVVALKNASLSVKSGEIRAIFGGNGSGKSTLAKILGGSVFKNDGEILIDGKKTEMKSPISAIRHGVAVTSQELSLLPNRTVLQNLTLLNTPKRFLFFENRAAARSRATKALERVGLVSLLNTPVLNLSDNQKHLIEFAKALLCNPRILVIDEITSPLRGEEVALVGKILKEIASKGRIILYISHRMNEIFDICTSVTVLRNGEVINTYPIDKVSEHILLTDMIGSELGKRHRDDKVVAQSTGDRKTALSVKGIKIKGFSSEPVNLELKEGEILGIAGLQGQGQSELLKYIFGLYGTLEVEIGGKKKKITSPISAISNGMGYLTGDRPKEGVFYGRTIGENLDLVNNLVLKREALKDDEVLKRYGVKYKSITLPIETLSGGNQQKVVLSRWTSVRPAVLLADDPTKGIDVSSKLEVYDIFRQIAREKSAIIFVSSDDEELVVMAQNTDNYSVAIMYNGRIINRLYGAQITTANIISSSIPGGKR